MLIGTVAFFVAVAALIGAVWWLGLKASDSHRAVAARPQPAASPAQAREAGAGEGEAEAGDGATARRRPEWLAHDSPEAVFNILWPLHERGEATAEEQDALVFLAQELGYVGKARAVLDARLKRTDPAPDMETRVLESRQWLIEGNRERAEQVLAELLKQPGAWKSANTLWLTGQMVEQWVQRREWNKVISTLQPVGVPLPPIFHRHLARALAATGDRAGVARLVDRHAGSFQPLERVRARLVIAGNDNDTEEAALQVAAGLEILRGGATPEDWEGFVESVGSVPQYLPEVLEAASRDPSWRPSDSAVAALALRATRAGTWAANRTVFGWLESRQPGAVAWRHNRLYLDLVADATRGPSAVAEARDLTSSHPQAEFQATLMLALLRSGQTSTYDLSPVLERWRAGGGTARASHRWIAAWAEAALGHVDEARALLVDFDPRQMLPEEQAIYAQLRRNLGLTTPAAASGQG